jgi:hypothetical protein
LPPRASLATGNVNQNPFQKQIWFTFDLGFDSRRALPAGNVNQNPFQKQIWFTFDLDFDPRRPQPAGNINQNPFQDRFGLHSILIPAPGGLRSPEM